MTGTPAYVRNARMDVVAANSLCFALYADILSPETLPINLARVMFLDQRSRPRKRCAIRLSARSSSPATRRSFQARD